MKTELEKITDLQNELDAIVHKSTKEQLAHNDFSEIITKLENIIHPLTYNESLDKKTKEEIQNKAFAIIKEINLFKNEDGFIFGQDE